MKVYLDTTVIILLLFGEKSQPERHAEVIQLFAALDANRLQAVVSLYALQELCAFCFDNFPADQSPRVARLAFHELLEHELLIAPLLNRMDRIILSRRFPMEDTSDQVHAVTADKQGCEAIVTYDQHYQVIADRILCLTAADVVDRLSAQ